MLDFSTYGSRRKAALLLLHAGGMTREEWEPFLSAWAEHFFVITPSALAHGGSSNVPKLSISRMADATLALLDELGVERAHVLGSSMGGAIALWLALTVSERLHTLAIYRMSYHSSPHLFAEVQRMAAPEAWQAWRMEAWIREQHLSQGGPQAWQTVTQKVADAFDPATTDHHHDLGDLATIDLPTLIISGDRDPVVSLDEAVAMYNAIPDASLWVVPHATHFMGMEGWRRQSFEQELLRFWRRNGERAG
ncbi:MAG: alpha/beta fold hydrolase [Anaerolineales bacterium]|nr:alpha/beta fold hydrolase [Anaerolineales bacterium]MCB9128630.1 alpha/beta fold hydrolase [Ardenticatenales bacterium]